MQQEVKIDNETSEMENCVSTHDIVYVKESFNTGYEDIHYSPIHLSCKRTLNIEESKRIKMYLSMESNFQHVIFICTPPEPGIVLMGL